MAAGYGAVGACFTTSKLALDAHWGSQPVISTPATTTSIFFHHSHIRSGDNWVLSTDRCTMTDNTPICTRGTSTLPTYTPTACTLNNSIDSFTDGALLGWGVVAAMVAAWIFLQMRRAL